MNLAKRLHRRIYGLAVDAGLAPYRRPWNVSDDQWDADYASGALDFYGALREQGRYGVLVGLIRTFPGPARILDVGCGVGVLRARIPDEAFKAYVGIDPSAVAIEQARGCGFARSLFHVGKVPTEQMGQFDLIVLNEMIYYVEDLDGLLMRLKARLAPGGWLLTSVFAHPGDSALHRAVGRRFTEIESVTVSRQIAPKRTWRVGCYGQAGTDAEGLREAVGLEPAASFAPPGEAPSAAAG